MKYSPSRKIVIDTLARTLAFFQQNAEEGMSTEASMERLRLFGTRINRTPVPTDIKDSARYIVSSIEEENFWPENLQDLGLFCDAQSIGPVELGVALAVRENFTNDYLTPAQERWLDELFVGESDVIVNDGGVEVDFAVWSKPQRLEAVRLTTQPRGVRIEIEREDGTVFTARHRFVDGRVSRVMIGLRESLPDGVRLEVDGASTYRNDPSFDQILSSYRRNDPR